MNHKENQMELSEMQNFMLSNQHSETINPIVEVQSQEIHHELSSIGNKEKVPDMWSLQYIGLYCQYAAVGLIYGSKGTLYPFCYYFFNGESNVCANAGNITTFAWSLKIFYAMITDCYRPMGMRRKPWMIFGWSGVLLLMLVLACTAESMSASVWLVMLLFVQAFMMFSDVPADGMSVELGKLESEEQRGQILATGQRIRFLFCMIAGLIQSFLLNGRSANEPDCEINFDNCWGWGLSVNQYYGLMFALLLLLTWPIYFLNELDSSTVPVHTVSQYLHEAWLTMQNLTTTYLVIFVAGNGILTNFTNNANLNLQYELIQLTNFQAGIDTVSTYAALVLAIWIFQKYLINKNWRYSQYGSTIFSTLLGFLWYFSYYNIGGTRSPWFTIFVDLDQSFAQGISQVLYSMAVIELAKPGQEATTYELIITIGNSALTISGIISTQMLAPFNAIACSEADTSKCGSDTVDLYDSNTFEDTNGPNKFAAYSVTLSAITIAACLIFTPFLPKSKTECVEWTKKGEKLGESVLRGKCTLAFAFMIMAYGITVSIVLLDSKTSCEAWVGGSGC